MNLIVAVDEKWAISKDNKLLVNIPEDKQYFREMTKDNIVIVGKNTLESFPDGKPLEDRVNIVVALEKHYIKEGVVVVHNLEDAVKKAKEYEDKDVYVIGGSSIFRQFLPYCKKAYITKIYKTFEDADTFIPNLDELENWAEMCESVKKVHEGLEYTFVTYVNKKLEKLV